MRLIDADKLIARMADYGLQECEGYHLHGTVKSPHEAILDCIGMVEEAETVPVLRLIRGEADEENH